MNTADPRTQPVLGELSAPALRFLAHVPADQPITVRRVGYLAELPYYLLRPAVRELVRAGLLTAFDQPGPGALALVRRVPVP